MKFLEREISRMLLHGKKSEQQKHNQAVLEMFKIQSLFVPKLKNPYLTTK
jgi:hypothetical protein